MLDAVEGDPKRLFGTRSDRVVEAHALDEAPVAAQARIGNDDVEEGALFRTAAGKPDHDHDEILWCRDTSREKPRIINSRHGIVPSNHDVSELLIRPSRADDLDAVTSIYAWNVVHGTGTFEIEAPDRAEMERRRADVLAKGLPWIVLERTDQVVGYAYANQFRPRPAYRFCLEDSVYLAPDAVGRGFGRLLLAELLARCEAAGARQMLAVIGDSANAGSIGVHRALGFAPVGTMKAAGRKFDRWLDVVVMQKSLGLGDSAPAG
jgi:L-amino acid N-acyltransferase YncA